MEYRLNYLRSLMSCFTVDDAILFLRYIGGYDQDKITFYRHKYCTLHKLSVHKLVQYVAMDVLAKDVKIAFEGGPKTDKFYNGTLLHLTVDRALLACCKKDLREVTQIIGPIRKQRMSMKQGTCCA